MKEYDKVRHGTARHEPNLSCGKLPPLPPDRVHPLSKHSLPFTHLHLFPLSTCPRPTCTACAAPVQAIETYQRGLELEPDNAELKDGLQRAVEAISRWGWHRLAAIGRAVRRAQGLELVLRGAAAPARNIYGVYLLVRNPRLSCFASVSGRPPFVRPICLPPFPMQHLTKCRTDARYLPTASTTACLLPLQVRQRAGQRGGGQGAPGAVAGGPGGAEHAQGPGRAAGGVWGACCSRGCGVGGVRNLLMQQGGRGRV